MRQGRREGKQGRGERQRKEEGERERVQKALYCDTLQLFCLKPVQYHGQSLTNLSYVTFKSQLSDGTFFLLPLLIVRTHMGNTGVEKERQKSSLPNCKLT